MGYAAGYYAKIMTQKMMTYAAIGAAGLLWLNWMNYITINWGKLDEDIFNLVSKV